MGDSRDKIASDFNFLFKPIANVRNGGCRVEVWLPEEIPESPMPLAMSVLVVMILSC
jgi:hypothetical protein